MSVCISVCVCVCVCVHVRVCIHIHVCMYACTCMYVCMYMYMYIYNVCVFCVYVCTMCVCVCVCVCVLFFSQKSLVKQSRGSMHAIGCPLALLESSSFSPVTGRKSYLLCNFFLHIFGLLIAMFLGTSYEYTP